MGRYLNLGNAGFQSIRKDLYVDKSGIIAQINGTLGTPNKLTCVSRPRRFGKSFTAESLRLYIDLDLDGLKENLMQMLGGMKCRIDSGTFQNDMTTIKSKDDVLTLLVHLGYLAYDAPRQAVFIPNEEVRQEFLRAVKAGRHKEIIKIISASDQLLQDTLNMDGKKVAAMIQRIHKMSFTNKGRISPWMKLTRYKR